MDLPRVNGEDASHDPLLRKKQVNTNLGKLELLRSAGLAV